MAVVHLYPKDDLVHAVERTWKERLFSRPWRPLERTKQVPNMAVYQVGHIIYGHSVALRAMMQQEINRKD